jgi:hypothetical protein
LRLSLLLLTRCGESCLPIVMVACQLYQNNGHLSLCFALT